MASKTLEEHRRDVLAVWTRFAARGHSIKPSKAKILQDEIDYLEHVSTPTGLMPTNAHVRAIVDMPDPVGADEKVDPTRLRSFLGMVN